MTVLMLDRSARARLARMFDALERLLDEGDGRRRLAKMRTTFLGKE